MSICSPCAKLKSLCRRPPAHVVNRFTSRGHKAFAPDCDICEIIESIIEKWSIWHRPPFREVAVRLLRAGAASPDLKFTLNACYGHSGKVYQFYCDPSLSFPRSLFPIHGDDTAQEPLTASLAIGREWLDCCRLHHRCGHWDETSLPKRVIYVGRSDNEVHLVIPGSSTGKYTCLSHCWGDHQPLKLEESTIQSFLKQIPWEKLPKTFQEAISLTRALGLDFIWIDSMCILQDNLQDWEQESAAMGTTYRNSYLTVAATAAKDGRLGLHTERVNRRTDFISARRVEYLLSSRVKIRHASKFEPPKGLEIEFPLLSRAWAYQERLLSSRILHFGPDELFWECHQEVRCECGHNKDINLARRSHMLGDASHHKWRDVVEEYSAMCLTKASDKLPAIAGLAAETAREKPSAQYLAGLWSDSLAMDLLWYTWSDMYRSPKASYRYNNWRAPSWSWASIDAEIIWPQSEYQFSRKDTKEEHFTFEVSILPQVDLARLTTVSGPMTPSLELRGTVFKGRLNLGGYLGYAELFDSQKKSLCRSDVSSRDEIKQAVYLDDLDELWKIYGEHENIDVLCMNMGMMRHLDDIVEYRKEYALVLTVIENGENMYRRAGMAICTEMRLLEGSHPFGEESILGAIDGIWKTIKLA